MLISDEDDDSVALESFLCSGVLFFPVDFAVVGRGGGVELAFHAFGGDEAPEALPVTGVVFGAFLVHAAADEFADGDGFAVEVKLAGGGRGDVGGGFWTPVSAMGDKLLVRLEAHAGLSFKVVED